MMVGLVGRFLSFVRLHPHRSKQCIIPSISFQKRAHLPFWFLIDTVVEKDQPLSLSHLSHAGMASARLAVMVA